MSDPSTFTTFDERNEELNRGITVIRELAASANGPLAIGELLDVVMERAHVCRARAAGAVAELVDDHEFRREGDLLSPVQVTSTPA